jgi:hypothetical protein
LSHANNIYNNEFKRKDAKAQREKNYRMVRITRIARILKEPGVRSQESEKI